MHITKRNWYLRICVEALFTFNFSRGNIRNNAIKNKRQFYLKLRYFSEKKSVEFSMNISMFKTTSQQQNNNNNNNF